ncbi:MAG: redoxin domain-containing protein [Bacteroidetes bacterium]|nr:redoxin domain-containing protein [Bacteroidota bacterium]
MKTLRQTYQPQSVRAPELYGDRWFNSEPLSLRAAEGEIVLLFFWSYTSPGSLRMLQVINEWYETYAPLGLICIGVHAPEFPFARLAKNVEEVLREKKVSFPVVADNDRVITEAYRIPDIPSVVLVGSNGNIYDIVASLSSFTRLERSLQYLLRQSGFFGELPPLRSYGDAPDGRGRSMELMTGYLHGSLGNTEGYSPELPAEYRDPRFYVAGKFYAHGIWRAERNAFHYDGPPNEGYLVCSSSGEDIDVLIGSEQRTSVSIRVDEASMLLEQMRTDVKRDAKGNSSIAVGDPQFYAVFRGLQHQQHAVKFIPAQSGVTFYKFSLHSEPTDDDAPASVRNN